MIFSTDIFTTFAGFVHYIARTCSVSEDPFIDRVNVDKDACVDDFDYLQAYHIENQGLLLAREGSICRCSDDFCNNKKAKEIQISKSKLSNISIVIIDYYY